MTGTGKVSCRIRLDPTEAPATSSAPLHVADRPIKGCRSHITDAVWRRERCDMQENSRRTAFGRKGHDHCRSRIVFHATSFMVTETGHELGAQISATYGTLTPIRQASQASEPNRQITPAGSNDADSASAFCAKESSALNHLSFSLLAN